MKPQIIRPVSRFAAIAATVAATVALCMFPMLEIGRSFERHDHRTSFPEQFVTLASTLEAENLHVSNSVIVDGETDMNSLLNLDGNLHFNSNLNTLDMNLGFITNLMDPTNGSDAATKSYVDAHGGGSLSGGGTNGSGARWTSSTSLGNASFGDSGSILTINALADGVAVDNTTFAAPSAFVNNYAFPANARTVVIGASGVGAAALVTGIVAPTTSYRRISIVSNAGQCLSVYDDNTNSTITNRIKLQMNATANGFLCNGGSLDCIYDPNAGTVTPGRWVCSITWAQQSPSSVTINGALTATGNVIALNASFAGFIGANNGVYEGAASDVVLHTSDIMYGVGSNAAYTGYINAAGYNELLTQPRSLGIGDGEGSSSSHLIEFLDGATRSAAFYGHVKAIGGIAPSFSNALCNSTTCTDYAGTIQTSSTTMTITFGQTYTNADDAGCILQEMGGTVVPTFTTSATALTATVVVSGVKYHYICVGH